MVKRTDRRLNPLDIPLEDMLEMAAAQELIDGDDPVEFVIGEDGICRVFPARIDEEEEEEQE